MWFEAVGIEHMGKFESTVSAARFFFRRQWGKILAGAIVAWFYLSSASTVSGVLDLLRSLKRNAPLWGHSPWFPWGVALVFLIFAYFSAIRPGAKSMARLADLKEKEHIERDLIYDLATAVAANDHEHMVITATTLGVYPLRIRESS